jgi:hypothetical protein
MVAIRVHTLTVVITASSSDYMVKAAFQTRANRRAGVHAAGSSGLYTGCIAREHMLLTHCAGTSATA